ncbi:AfsR/SARP family transcriptional regulator [Nocardiopsis deserti]|uniref:AfsR/SARP family transcriptional regulator n=1 Tax=Nocardiopsis deserti TaxID=2605988 RepID=UPI00123B9F45|nr:AfsR/SARP family transcriptional regulator [Nocardiopsis deserti]
MRYEILGPLRIIGENGDTEIKARKIETLLTVFLIRANQVVSIDELILEMWGEHPPKRATAGLHVYISQLRKLLRQPGDKTRRIITRAPGYTLEIDDDQIDYLDLQRHVDEGRRLSRDGHHRDAVRSFETALDTWRGNVPHESSKGPILDGFVAWTDEIRLEAMEMLVESRLALGEHRELIAQLRRLVAEHPFREAFYHQLMLALYRADRQAEALRVYHTARAMLNRELGLEPCRSLRDLQRGILSEDAELRLLADADASEETLYSALGFDPKSLASSGSRRTSL